MEDHLKNEDKLSQEWEVGKFISGSISSSFRVFVVVVLDQV